MTMTLAKPMAFEEGNMLYLVAPVTPHAPSANEIEEYAFGKSVISQLQSQAPSEHIAWFGGHYVEADRPNLNGAMWLGKELAIASLTPVMMPVTVMHDPRTAVGVIAHAALRTPEKDQVPRNKIETALATWKHRFPEAVAEAEHNHAQGTLMQSMECLAPSYDCSVCGMHFVKLPEGKEQANWCDHLKASHPSGGYTASADAENDNASRILRGVTFTGTGLIFGSRGAKGADPEANLEAFQEEVAEFHARAHRDTKHTPKKPTSKSRSSRKMEIEQAEYDRIIREREEAQRTAAEATKERDEAKSTAEAAEAAKVAAEAKATAAEEAKEAAEAEKTKLEEQANRATLATTRFESLGSAFREKIDGMPTTKGNLLKDAEVMADEAWDKRLGEVEETTGIKRDAKKDGSSDEDGNGDEQANKNGLFDREEVARFQGGSDGDGGGKKEPTVTERRSVMAGLTKPPAKAKQ
jgi:flagellar biosynthesis GTPase FlhF